MKNTLSTLLLVAAASGSAYAQDLSNVTLSRLRTNVVVPDLPAFKSLGTEPSNLLRPSTPQAFATSFSEFYSGGRIIVPAAFAAEVTPAQLLNAREPLAQLQEYASNSVLNSFRISAGTARDTVSGSGGRRLALGARINLINQGELATDRVYTDSVLKALQDFRLDALELRKRFAKSKGIDTSAKAKEPWDEVLDTHPQWKSSWKAEYAALEADTNAWAGQREFLGRIEAIREDYRRRHWNDKRLDLALAVSSASPDSLLANIRFRRADLWMTYAVPALRRRGQFLIGINTNLARADSLANTSGSDAHFNLAVPARLLIGTNRLKGFGEVQYSYAGMDGTHKTFLNLGSELNIIDGVWVNFYAGVDYNLRAEVGTFKTNLDLKLTLPENFSLF